MSGNRDEGVYLMHRGWMDHDVFGNKPYSEREAWEWMISEAEYEPGVVLVEGVPVNVGRGQFTASHRFLAQKWRWDKNKVARYIEKIAKRGMIRTEIEAQSGAGQSLITICNYAKFQDYMKLRRGSKRAENGAQTERKTGQTITQLTQLTHSTGDFDALWSSWRPFDMDKGNKQPAMKSYEKAVTSGADPAAILSAAKTYCDNCNQRRCKTQHVATWLNQRGWENVGASAGVNGGPRPLSAREQMALTTIGGTS